MDNIQIAKRIKELCKHENMTVKSLLSDCEINSGFIHGLEKRGQIPSLYTIARIAEYLDVSIDYLAGLTDDPQSTYVSSTISKQDLVDIAKKPQSQDLSKEEAEIIGLYRMLNVRDRTKLMSFIFELEDNLQKV